MYRRDITEIIVKSFKHDSDFENIIGDYYCQKQKKILIFKFSENDLDKINQLKFKINHIEKEIAKKNKVQEKHIIFIISLNRHKIETKIEPRNNVIYDLISNIDEEYNQYFIDNLSGTIDSNIISSLSKSPTDYLEKIFNLKNNYILNIIQKVFTFLTYEFKGDIEGQNYIGDIINNLLNNKYVLKLLKNRLEKELGKTLNTYIKTIFSKGIFEKSDIEFIDIIFNAIYDKVSLILFKFIFRAEKDHYLYPLLFNCDHLIKEKELKNYIEKYIDNIDFNRINVVERINSNQITLFMNLLLPLSKKWYDLINVFIENNIKEEYLTNEDYIRLSDFKKDVVINKIDDYERKKQDLVNNTKGEILRIDGLNDLIKSKNKE